MLTSWNHFAHFYSPLRSIVLGHYNTAKSKTQSFLAKRGCFIIIKHTVNRCNSGRYDVTVIVIVGASLDNMPLRLSPTKKDR
jgi:hypothetical protein